MIIDQVNLNLIRVFHVVYRTGNMTEAAHQLHMTQSGVSQHIKNLEDTLQTKLFDRISKKLVPTRNGRELYKASHSAIESLEKSLNQITGSQGVLKGMVAIGLPIEFGNNVVLPLLTKWGKEHPEIRYTIQYGGPSEMNAKLLSGELDIAFVDTYKMDNRIKATQITQEELYLCASSKYIKDSGLSSKNLESQSVLESFDYIDYVSGAPFLTLWQNHHFGSKKFRPKLKATLMNVRGMARMITEGFGVGILPGHALERLKNEGHVLHVFFPKKSPLLNTLSIAYHSERSLDRSVSSLIDFLSDQFGKN